MNSTEDTTYMTCILQKLWPKTDLKQVPDIWIAYAASTSEILLNPSIPTIQISEAKMKLRLKKYLKVVEKIIIMLTKFFHWILRAPEVRKEMKNIETKKKNMKSK